MSGETYNVGASGVLNNLITNIRNKYKSGKTLTDDGSWYDPNAKTTTDEENKTETATTEAGDTITADKTEKTEASKPVAITENMAISAATKYVYGDTMNSTGNGFVYETDSGVEKDDTFVNTLEDMLSSSNFVQFIVDPDIQISESFSNGSSQSQIKAALDSGSSFLKELSFVTNSAGFDISGFQEFSEDALSQLSSHIAGMSGGGVTTALSRVLSSLGNVLKGENLIMPDIYQSSEYSKSYSFTVHLKNPYGSRLGYYLEIFVPLMHLLALCLPKQTTANTYGAPFLVKCMCDALFTCNLGLVTSLSVNKEVAPEGWTIDGLPNEVDVNVGITDLYSDLTMSPQNEPLLFLNNSSLIDYLATQCGLSLVNPTLEAKYKAALNTLGNALNLQEQFGNVEAEVVEGLKEKATTVMRDSPMVGALFGGLGG